MFKKIFILCCCALTICSLSYAETLDRIVAVVNDEPITQSELDVFLLPIYEQYKEAYSGPEFVAKMNEAQVSMLNQLIEDRLIVQQANTLGVEVSDDEIDAQLQEIKNKFPSESDFQKFLEAQNITVDKLRKRYKEQIAVRKLHAYEVRQKVSVSPRQIEEYYEEHLDDFSDKEKVKVRTILIKKKAFDTDVDPSRALIDKIVSDLEGGVSFEELAKQYSEGMNNAEGGDLGFVEKGDLIPAFDDVLFSLSVGERSGVIETEMGYHIFVVEAKQERKEKNLSEVKEEIRGIIYREKMKERYESWIQDLKEDAYISIK